MTEIKTSDFEAAIKRGKAFMSKSLDIGSHDAPHAQNVSEYGEKILVELCERRRIKYSEYLLNLFLVAAWWHDCYKSLYVKSSFYGLFNEGDESAIIVQKELCDILTEKDMKIVTNAIRIHNKPYMYAFKWGKAPIIDIVLMEADATDDFIRLRANSITDHSPNIFYMIFTNYILYIGVATFYFIMPFTKFARERVFNTFAYRSREIDK